MKKRNKVILGALLTVLILLSAGILGYNLKFKYETDKMNTLESGEIIPGVYAVKNDYANFYLIQSDHGYIAIDAGLDQKASRRELEKLHINPEKVTAILLTHSDFDHTASIALFPNAAIYLAKEEEQMVNGQTKRQFIFSNKLDRSYQTLENEEIVLFDNLQIQGFLTPGHTPGSMSYLVNGKYLFTGDILGLVNGRAGCFNEDFNMDTKLQEETLRNLARRPAVDYIFTAHYGYTNDYAKAFEKWQ